MKSTPWAVSTRAEGRTVTNGFDDGAMMRAAPMWREALAAEHAAVRARLRQAIEVDEECDEAV